MRQTFAVHKIQQRPQQGDDTRLQSAALPSRGVVHVKVHVMKQCRLHVKAREMHEAPVTWQQATNDVHGLHAQPAVSAGDGVKKFVLLDGGTGPPCNIAFLVGFRGEPSVTKSCIICFLFVLFIKDLVYAKTTNKCKQAHTHARRTNTHTHTHTHTHTNDNKTPCSTSNKSAITTT